MHRLENETGRSFETLWSPNREWNRFEILPAQKSSMFNFHIGKLGQLLKRFTWPGLAKGVEQ